MKTGWQVQPLQALCHDIKKDIVDGPFGSSMKRKDYITEGIPVLKIQNVKPFKIELKNMDYLSPTKADALKRHSYRCGDIVMTKLGDPLGVSAIVNGVDDGIIVADLVRIRAQRINTKFLCYHLNSPQTNEFINSMQKGTTRPRVRLSVVRELPINVPLEDEQRRIVALLDDAFAGLATAKANAEKNLQSARALFECHLQSVFTKRGKGWVEMTLEEAAADDCSLSYGIVQPGDEVEGGLHVVRPTDLTQDTISLDGLKRIDPKRAESYQRTTLQGCELLLCVRGTTGVVSKTAPELKGANVTRGIVPIRFNSKLLRTDFGFHLLRAGPVQAQIRTKTYGAALMQINIGDLRKVLMAFPPLNEQRSIATQFDALATETQRLAKLYERKLAEFEALKKSLLHQAFAGKL